MTRTVIFPESEICDVRLGISVPEDTKMGGGGGGGSLLGLGPILGVVPTYPSRPMRISYQNRAIKEAFGGEWRLSYTEPLIHWSYTDAGRIIHILVSETWMHYTAKIIFAKHFEDEGGCECRWPWYSGYGRSNNVAYTDTKQVNGILLLRPLCWLILLPFPLMPKSISSFLPEVYSERKKMHNGKNGNYDCNLEQRDIKLS